MDDRGKIGLRYSNTISWKNKDAYVYKVEPTHQRNPETDLEFVIFIPIDTAVRWLDIGASTDGSDKRQKGITSIEGARGTSSSATLILDDGTKHKTGKPNQFSNEEGGGKLTYRGKRTERYSHDGDASVIEGGSRGKKVPGHTDQQKQRLDTSRDRRDGAGTNETSRDAAVTRQTFRGDAGTSKAFGSPRNDSGDRKTSREFVHKYKGKDKSRKSREGNNRDQCERRNVSDSSKEIKRKGSKKSTGSINTNENNSDDSVKNKITKQSDGHHKSNKSSFARNVPLRDADQSRKKNEKDQVLDSEDSDSIDLDLDSDIDRNIRPRVKRRLSHIVHVYYAFPHP